MPPTALIDLCGELLAEVMIFSAPADNVVSSFLRSHRALGPRERHSLAETTYEVLRHRLRWQHLAQSGSGSLHRRLAILAWQGNDAFLRGDSSQFQTYAGNYDKAVAWADFAIKNDPALLAMYAMYKGWAQTAAERYAESRETTKEAGEIFIQAPLLRAINAVRLGSLDEAKIEIGKAVKMIPGFTAARWREVAFASDPAILDRQIADLVKAGLPEK